MTQDLPEVGLTIGAVSRAAGIPSNTLRTWERRYGFPNPTRTAGGQRLYDPATIPRLHLISRLLAQGLRPAQIIALPVEQLRRLESPAKVESQHQEEDQFAQWLAATRALDGQKLNNLFQVTVSRVGSSRFLIDYCAPFMEHVGDLWHEGKLEVYQEHFATEHLRTYLFGLWRPMSDANTGPTVVCATLPGELHDLGIAFAALMFAQAGWQVIYIGRNTPMHDLLECASHVQPRAVCMSISAYAEAQSTRAYLVTARARLNDNVDLLIGGKGAPQGLSGIVTFTDLGSLQAWSDGFGS